MAMMSRFPVCFPSQRVTSAKAQRLCAPKKLLGPAAARRHQLNLAGQGSVVFGSGTDASRAFLTTRPALHGIGLRWLHETTSTAPPSRLNGQKPRSYPSQRPEKPTARSMPRQHEDDGVPEGAEEAYQDNMKVYSWATWTFAALAAAAFYCLQTEDSILAQTTGGPPGEGSLMFNAETLEKKHPVYYKYAAIFGGEGFVKRLFSYRPSDWLQPPLAVSMASYVGYQFAHANVIHFLCNFVALRAMTEIVAIAVRPRTAIVVFLSGGFLAANLHCGIERLFNPFAKMSETERQEDMSRLDREIAIDKARARRHVQEQMRAPPEQLGELKRRQVAEMRQPSVWERLRSTQHRMESQKYFMSSVGASSSVICLGTIACFIFPQAPVSMLFINCRIWQAMASLFAFDLFFAVTRIPDGLGIGHLGHIGGNISGVLMWYLCLRRGRVGQALAQRKMKGASST